MPSLLKAVTALRSSYEPSMQIDKLQPTAIPLLESQGQCRMTFPEAEEGNLAKSKQAKAGRMTGMRAKQRSGC